MNQSKQSRPLICSHRNRLLAVRIMLSALRDSCPRYDHILDEDNNVAALVGARRYSNLRAAAQAEIESATQHAFRAKTSAALYMQLKRLLRESEHDLAIKTRNRQDHLSRNVTALARLVGLNLTESKILELAVRRECDEGLDHTIQALRDMDASPFARYLSQVIRSRKQDVNCALRDTSRLAQSGLLEIAERDFERRHARVGFDSLKLMPRLADSLYSSEFRLEKVFAPYFRQCGDCNLQLSDFDYLSDDLTVLRGLLRGAVSKPSGGVQILLHGAPGTGKTQLAHALARAVGATLYSVASGDTAGGPYDRDERFRSFRLAQHALRSQHKTMILFDEIEDVFDAPLGLLSDNRRDKGWTNNLLETAAVPSIWITNSTRCMDAAYLRRFSLVLEIDRPPRSVRRRIAAQYLGKYGVENRVLDRVAEARSITPADLERTRQALRIGKDLRKDADIASRTAVTLLGSGPRGPGVTALRAGATLRLPDFDPALINTDLDLERVLAGLGQSGEGRLCLYGQPGTGKTAFAKYIAQRLNRDLITVSASDWLAPFVGMTERLIRQSFEQAQRENAVLFVDEADNFLRDRNLATQSWQVTQVNELLKCLEDARGIVMFATNAFDALDPAVLRRLDIKAAFRPLNRRQAAAMFTQTLGLNASNDASADSIDAALDQLGQLNGLVNGDFAAACRRLHVSAQGFTPQALLDALADELQLRDRHQCNAIGFAAPVS